MPRHPWALLLTLASLALVAPAGAQAPLRSNSDPLTGPRSRLAKNWLGVRPLAANQTILVLAGHADSQGIGGAGTSGEAVGRRGARPMQPGITDELYWNLLTARAVVRLGLERGLSMRLYEPPVRSIADGNDPRTNWSVGRAHAAEGGYAVEIHYDAYGPDGIGSGLIPPLHNQPSRLDESLASEFGAFPLQFRNGLGAPRRGIAILEIGKLEGNLEAALRNPASSEAAVEAIAGRIVAALGRGLANPPGGEPLGEASAGPLTGALNAPSNAPGVTTPGVTTPGVTTPGVTAAGLTAPAVNSPLPSQGGISAPPDGERSGPPGSRLRASAGGG
jgi:hypothetical protein